MPSEGEPTWVYIPSNNVRRPRHGSRRGSAWAERRRNRIHRTHERRWRVDDLSSEPRGCATRKGTRGTDRERAGDELQEGASPVHKRPLRKKRASTMRFLDSCTKLSKLSSLGNRVGESSQFANWTSPVCARNARSHLIRSQRLRHSSITTKLQVPQFERIASFCASAASPRRPCIVRIGALAHRRIGAP